MIKNLFIIDGAAASSKTDLIKFLEDEYVCSGEAKYIRKFTTREERPKEKERKEITDLDHITTEQFEEKKKAGKDKFLHYKYEEESYGFFVSDVEDAFNDCKNVFIVIRDVQTVNKIRKLLKGIRVILVYVFMDENVAKKRLGALEYNEQQIQERIDRCHSAWEDFLRHSKMYRKVILNTSELVNYHALIRKLIEYYNQENADYIEVSDTHRYLLSKELRGYKPQIMNRIKETEFEKNVFLMMKFRDENTHLYTLIKTKLKEHGYNCLRADDINITEKPSNPFAVLYCCKYGIALFDKAEENNAYSPNVAFEIGMMYAQDKEFLILRNEDLPEPPFDIATHLYRNYSNDNDINMLVEKWISDIKMNNNL